MPVEWPLFYDGNERAAARIFMRAALLVLKGFPLPQEVRAETVRSIVRLIPLPFVGLDEIFPHGAEIIHDNARFKANESMSGIRLYVDTVAGAHDLRTITHGEFEFPRGYIRGLSMEMGMDGSGSSFFGFHLHHHDLVIVAEYLTHQTGEHRFPGSLALQAKDLSFGFHNVCFNRLLRAKIRNHFRISTGGTGFLEAATRVSGKFKNFLYICAFAFGNKNNKIYV